MKKLLYLGIILTLLSSCRKDEEPITTQSCIATSAKSADHYFYDVEIANVANIDNFSRFYYTYDSQKRITKVDGGLKLVSPLLGTGYYISPNVQDEISYSADGNTIYVKLSANQTSRPYDKEFLIQNNKIISQKVKYVDQVPLYPIPAGTAEVNYKYEYVGNTVLEKYDGILNNRLNKTFTIENGKLTKIELWLYNGTNLSGKQEALISSFTNVENLLKNKFYINGAFYLAFSDYTWNVMNISSYEYINGQFVFSGGSIATQKDGTNYFEKMCN